MPEPFVLYTGGVQLLILLLGISAHEAAHAWAAARYGDPTARLLGRTSLNPLRHLDLFGSLLLPVLLLVVGAPLFGWGRPTPVVVKNLRERKHLMRIALAGPLVNLALAGLGMAVLTAAVQLGGAEWRQVAGACLYADFSEVSAEPGFALLFVLLNLVLLNAFLALFHLLPVPPLDGGRIMLGWLPRSWARRLSTVQPFGMLIAMGLALFQVVTLLMLPVYALVGLVIHFG